MRRVLFILSLAYLTFVIYGSLVPWEFRPLPLDQAWAAFLEIRYLNLGIGSRADWVANILLFIPLAFFWQGIVWPRHNIGLRLLSTAAVWIGCFALSVGIEFTQLFFPPRTVSQNDILAESIGAAVGIAIWWWKGPALWDWVGQWRAARGATELAEKLLWAYLAALFGYGLLPLDLTISPVEIYHQWAEGKINLIPFATLGDDLAWNVYGLLTDIALWAPVSFLWIVSGKKNQLQAWTWTVTAALCLELLQLFVYSRTTDITDIPTAMLGAGLGAWMAGRWRSLSEPQSRRQNQSRLLWSIAGFGLWCLALAVVFWYPFDFRMEGGFLRERLALFSRVPFYAYYYGSEYRAATEFLHKVLFFAPLGAALALARTTLDDPFLKRLCDIAAIAGLGLIALAIELGQVALPGKSPDSTDWVLEMFGGGLGYFGLLFVLERVSAPERRSNDADMDPVQDQTQPAEINSPRADSSRPRRYLGPMAPEDSESVSSDESPQAPSIPSPQPLSRQRERGISFSKNRLKPSLTLEEEKSPIPFENPWLLTIALSCLGWMIWFSLAPFQSSQLEFKQLPIHLYLLHRPADFSLTPGFGGDMLLMFPVAFLLQGALWRLPIALPRPRPLLSAALWVGLSLFSASLAVVQAFFLPSFTLPVDLWAQQLSIILGILAWWGLSPLLDKPPRIQANLFHAPIFRHWRIAAGLLAAAVLLIPLEPASPLTGIGVNSSDSLLGYLKQVQASSYYWLKGIILWVPLGLAFTFAGRQHALLAWTVSALVGFLLLGPRFFSDFQVKDILELAFAPLGIWAGIWIGIRVRIQALSPLSMTVSKPQQHPPEKTDLSQAITPKINHRYPYAPAPTTPAVTAAAMQEVEYDPSLLSAAASSAPEADLKPPHAFAGFLLNSVALARRKLHTRIAAGVLIFLSIALTLFLVLNHYQMPLTLLAEKSAAQLESSWPRLAEWLRRNIVESNLRKPLSIMNLDALSRFNLRDRLPTQDYDILGRPIAFSPEKDAYGELSETPARSQIVTITTVSELQASIANASPGDIIEIASGAYHIRGHSIPIKRAGTEWQPIIVRAASFGEVMLEFDMLEGFHIMAPYWIFENLDIRGVCSNHNECEHAFHVVGKAQFTVIRNNRVRDFNAAIKANGVIIDGARTFPDHALVQNNVFYNSKVRNTGKPVTPIDIVGASEWVISGNLIADFIKGRGDQTSYAAFVKGNAQGSLFERNLVICEMNLVGMPGIRVGLSFGDGGSSYDVCRNANCDVEHSNGIMRNNIIMRCPKDVGIYLNKARAAKIYNNTLYDTLGIDVRFPESSAYILNNIVTGRIQNRDGATVFLDANLIGSEVDRLGTWLGDDPFTALFVDPEYGDFSLQYDRRIIDQGTPLQEVFEDFCGNRRIDGLPDIGAIEYSGRENCTDYSK